MRPALNYITATRALTGGESTQAVAQCLAPLGYAPDERRIYFAQCEVGQPSRVTSIVFMHTAGHHIGKLVPFRQSASERSQRLSMRARMQCLRERLMPLTERPSRDFTLATRVIRRRAIHFDQGSPIRKYILRLTLRPNRDAGVTSMWARVAIEAYLRPKTSITQVYAVPGERLAVAVVSYIGAPDGLGVRKDTALLVPVE